MAGLFDDLPTPKAQVESADDNPTKQNARGQDVEKPSSTTEEEKGSAPDAKRQKLGVRFSEEVKQNRTNNVTLDEALRKIANHIGQKAKCYKSCQLLLKLLDSGQLNHENSSSFFQVLKASLKDSSLSAEPDLRRIFRKVFLTAESRIQSFAEEEQKWIRAYSLLAIVRNELFTDDSFTYNKRIKFLVAEIKALGASAEADEGNQDIKHWECMAFVLCLESAISLYRLRVWSRASTDLFARVAFDNSQFFDELHREKIRKCWLFVQDFKNKAQSSKSIEETAFDMEIKKWNAKTGISKRSTQGGGDSWRQSESMTK